MILNLDFEFWNWMTTHQKVNFYPIFPISDEQDRVQKKTFVNWINLHLSKVKIEKLFAQRTVTALRLKTLQQKSSPNYFIIYDSRLSTYEITEHEIQCDFSISGSHSPQSCGPDRRFQERSCLDYALGSPVRTSAASRKRPSPSTSPLSEQLQQCSGISPKQTSKYWVMFKFKPLSEEATPVCFDLMTQRGLKSREVAKSRCFIECLC